MMLKQLKEIERNMYQILNEINSIGLQFINIQIDLWPYWNQRTFSIKIYDGDNHAKIDGFHSMSIEELIEWLRRKKILFQRFEGIV